MSEAKAPDIIEMRRIMTTKQKKNKFEECIQLAQEWKNSGLTQAAFAKSKGLTLEAVKYRIRKVRESAPEMLAGSALIKAEFAPVPKELVNSHGKAYETLSMTDQPVLMIQSGGACLQATNQIEPYILKTALEVMLTC